MHSELNTEPAILLLQDGTVYYGNAVGKIGTATGEVCFNTGMTGYQEIFTDASYASQLLIMSTPYIGNYGVKENEVESDGFAISGLICKNFSATHVRALADESLQNQLFQENIVGISDIDTRSLVRHIRFKGSMNGIISSEILDIEELREILELVPPMRGLELASKVSTSDDYTLGEQGASFKVAVLDFGVKKSILKQLIANDCYVKVFPAETSYKELKSWNANGYLLSNGPGDPSAMPYAIQTTKAILADQKPLFGICLGHQLMALAMDIPTYKMHNGHRGCNHPVKNILTERCEMTTQNHGFTVSEDAIKENKDKVVVTHINLNDHTIEGLRCKNKPAFSVQFHPEASPGPHDSHYLFDEFIRLMNK